jgi:hypothetical protein
LADCLIARSKSEWQGTLLFCTGCKASDQRSPPRRWALFSNNHARADSLDDNDSNELVELPPHVKFDTDNHEVFEVSSVSETRLMCQLRGVLNENQRREVFNGVVCKRCGGLVHIEGDLTLRRRILLLVL